MITVFIIIAFVLSLIGILEDYIPDKYKMMVLLGICFLLFCLAGFREIGFDNDSENYNTLYVHFGEDFLTKEVSFLFFSWFFNFFTQDVHIIFILYAILGIFTKVSGFRALSKDLWFVPMAIYFGNYFILHEMTQIRAGVAAGFFLMSLPSLADGNKRKCALYLLAALCFHYSSIILFSVLFLNNKELKVWHRYALAAVVPIGYFLFFTNLCVTSLPIPYLSEKIEYYEQMRDKGLMGTDINVFNSLYLLKIAIYYYMLLMYDVVNYHNKYTPLLIKILAISLFSFLYLSPIPIMAFRVMELFGVVDIILFSNIVYTVKPYWLSRSIAVCVGIVYIVINIYVVELLHEL